MSDLESKSFQIVKNFGSEVSNIQEEVQELKGRLEQIEKRIEKDLAYERFLAFEKEGLSPESKMIHQSRYGLLKDLLLLLEGKKEAGER